MNIYKRHRFPHAIISYNAVSVYIRRCTTSRIRVAIRSEAGSIDIAPLRRGFGNGYLIDRGAEFHRFRKVMLKMPLSRPASRTGSDQPVWCAREVAPTRPTAELVGNEQWQLLRELIEERNAENIVLNIDTEWAFSDGLHAGEREALQAALGLPAAEPVSPSAVTASSSAQARQSAGNSHGLPAKPVARKPESCATRSFFFAQSLTA